MARQQRAAKLVDPDVAAMRRVRIRLALLTVGMLLALVVTIVLVVYIRAQTLMQQSLRELTRTGAQHQVNSFTDAFNPKERDPHKPPAPEVDEQTTGVFIIFTDSSARYLGGDARQFGTIVPDTAAARAAIQQRSPLFSQQTIGAQGYLLYSLPVTIGGKVAGVIQAAASTRQYDQSMRDLLQVLLTVSAFGLLASACITTVLVRRALAPIRGSLSRQRNFVADAAHELRTPLTILRSAVELGLAGQDSAEQEAALTQALVESRHLGRLVDDLALLARADSGAQSLERAPVSLDQLVAETVQGVTMLAEDQDVLLHTRLSPGVTVLGDYGRLRQLLFILLDNALKHTPAQGEILIVVERAGNRARLQVQDSGPGIAPHDLPHLFDRFYRAGGERGAEGGGLGLAIALWIVRAHGGQISAANAAPHGATFTVLLPVQQ